MQNVNCPGDAGGDQPTTVHAEADDTIVGWVRWWHWLIVCVICLAAFLYYPVWSFDQRWNRLKVGDSLDRLKELLDDPGEPSYSVLRPGTYIEDDAFIYTRYWNSYEVIVAGDTNRVLSKSLLRGRNQPATNAAIQTR
jgi:hypothetical protein